MSTSSLLNTKTVAVVAGVALTGLALYLILKKLGILKEGAFNPGSDKNLAYGAVNSVGAAATGDKDFTLGGWLYDLTHPTYDPNAKVNKLQTDGDVLQMGAKNTDALWGKIGSVGLVN